MARNVTGSDASTVRVTAFGGPRDAWDAAVLRFGGTFCHLSGWWRVLEDVLGHETFTLVATDDSDEILGLLPMGRVRSRLFGDYLLSMPFLSYGGPLGSEEARRALAGSAVEHARSLGVDLLELRALRPVPGALATSSRKMTVVKALPASVDELWKSGLKAKLRSQVRRPMKEGMTSRFGLELLDAFYGVFARTMRDLGTPVLPRRFFEVVAREFSREALIGVVEHRGRTVAAGFGFAFGGEVEITWAGARRDCAAMAPNMLLYWAFMEESIGRGATRFNFGRCSPGSGTHRFKLQWGGEELPLPWAQWSPRGLTATPSPESAMYRLATALWRRLPVSLTVRVGPIFSRSLP
jgi:FemAB-related protein (PEP-CTERM system-associated)